MLGLPASGARLCPCPCPIPIPILSHPRPSFLGLDQLWLRACLSFPVVASWPPAGPRCVACACPGSRL